MTDHDRVPDRDRDRALGRLLDETFEDLAREAPQHADLAVAVRRRVRPRRAGAVAAAAAAAAVVAVAGVTSASRVADRPTGPAGPALTATPSACGPVETGVVPSWARAGFSDPEPSGIPFVRGKDGDIVAILFGAPLLSPPGPDRSNKVLWVSRVPVGGDALRIEARRDGSAEVVRREVAGGPGPSILDLPAPGCWHLRLAWGGHSDTIDLPVEAP